MKKYFAIIVFRLNLVLNLNVIKTNMNFSWSMILIFKLAQISTYIYSGALLFHRFLPSSKEN